MELQEILGKISNLNITGYYDQSNGFVVVWFHSAISNKADIVAYLKQDMSWDVREVVSEVSHIGPCSETVEIKHNLLGLFEKDSDFDTMIRKMFIKATEKLGDQDTPKPILMMKEILERNSYALVVLNKELN